MAVTGTQGPGNAPTTSWTHRSTTDFSQPARGLADAVHERVRLGLLTITREVRRAEFGYLRTSWEVTVSNWAR